MISKKTRPPVRFTEAALVKELEKRGIGRPSTYAAILQNIIQAHKYLQVDGKRFLVPTEQGEKVVDALGTFGFLDYEFTRKMEEQLDAIAEGKEQYRPVVAAAYSALQTDTGAYVEATSPKCPVCGKPLVHRFKKDAKEQKGYNFWGCSGFKDGCPATFANDGDKPGERQDNKPRAEPSGHKCPACRGDLVRRKGISKKTGKPYDFYACRGKCKATYNAREDGEPDLTPKGNKR